MKRSLSDLVVSTESFNENEYMKTLMEVMPTDTGTDTSDNDEPTPSVEDSPNMSEGGGTGTNGGSVVTDGSSEGGDDVGNVFKENDDTTETITEFSLLYDRLFYIEEHITKYGVSRDFVLGANHGNELYGLLPDLPSLEALPLIGRPGDEVSTYALESIKELAKSFWEWLKKTCAAIIDVLKKFKSIVSSGFKSMHNEISTLTNKIKSVDIDESKLSDVKIKAFSSGACETYTNIVVKDALSDISKIVKMLKDFNRLDGVKNLYKKDRNTLIAAGATNVVGVPLATYGTMLIGSMGAGSWSKRAFDNIGVGGAVVTAAAVATCVMGAIYKHHKLKIFEFYEEGGLDKYDKGTMKLNNERSMEEFQSEYEENTLSGHKWNKNTTTNVDYFLSVLKRHAEVNSAIDQAIEVSNGLNRMADSKSYTDDPAINDQLKVQARVGLMMTSDLQTAMKYITRMLTDLAKGIISAQKAVLSCAK